MRLLRSSPLRRKHSSIFQKSPELTRRILSLALQDFPSRNENYVAWKDSGLKQPEGLPEEPSGPVSLDGLQTELPAADHAASKLRVRRVRKDRNHKLRCLLPSGVTHMREVRLQVQLVAMAKSELQRGVPCFSGRPASIRNGWRPGSDRAISGVKPDSHSLEGQALAALGATPAQHSAASTGGHTGAKSTLASSLHIRWLIRSLHDFLSLSPASVCVRAVS